MQLLYSPGGSFAQDGQNVPLASVNFSPAINELQLFPARALPPGTYEVLLVGQSGGAGLADPTGIPLGADPRIPAARTSPTPSRSMESTGNVGPAAAADDTPATAHDLGNISSQGLIQVAGAIGADPFYDSSNPDPLFNPGNQVDLYHFRIQVQGGTRWSPRSSPAGSARRSIPASACTGLLPMATRWSSWRETTTRTIRPRPPTARPRWRWMRRSSAGLTAGDYYIAVSSGWNTPSPLENQPVNAPGLFDPTVSHSGSIGFSTGPYVLNLMVQPVHNPPRVIASSPAPGDVLSQSPTQLTVQFSEPVNLSQLAFAAYNQVTGEDPLPAIFIEDSSGVNTTTPGSNRTMRRPTPRRS